MNNRRRNALLMILAGILLPIVAIVSGNSIDSSGLSTLGLAIVSIFIGVPLIIIGLFRLIKAVAKR
ncbi:MAG: hypothetical protein ABSD10_04080 [Candidatus Saccharimonadales bacterium]|jgi:hypothetical protein